jgi:putative nucleotidyltransferase with HDIG domain
MVGMSINKKQEIDCLRSLHDISKAINSTLEIDEVVDEVLSKTSALMGSEEVIILLLETNKTVLTVHSYLAPEEREPQVKLFNRVRSFDHCLVHKGRVISLREIVPEDDYCRYLEKMPQLADMVFAPLEIKGEPYGLIGVLNGKKNFSEIELEVFCSLGSQAAIAIEHANLYKRLKGTFLHTAEALAEAINSRDPYTGGHTRRVKEYCEKIASALEMDEEEREDLRLAAILHDIGKIGIDDGILRKKDVLSGEEELLMRKHPEIGARILSHVEEMRGVIPGVLCHHERFDGLGYPEGLKGDEIPLHARIIAIADTFDTITTNRPYKDAIDLAAASGELVKNSDTQFDPSLIKVFCEVIKEIEEAR